MHARGQLFDMGHGVRKDMGEALRLFTLGAEQGHATSQLMLARMNRDAGGLVVAAVPREAARALRRRRSQKTHIPARR
jgi:TPR repeat protein